MKRPDDLQRGPKFLREAINSILAYAHAQRIATVLGGTLAESPDGQVLTVRPGAGGGGESADLPVPFDVVDASDGATKKLRIRLGTVKSDGALWIPTGMFPGDVTPLIMDVVGTSGVVALKMTVDGNGAPTSATIYIGATQPADSTTVGYKLLGTYGTDGEGNFLVTNHRVGDQAHLFCGIEHHFAQGSA